MKKISLAIICAVLFTVSLSAGDAASFVDLGFSADGRVYMFAEHGVQASSLRPWANIFIVDVPNNDFVPGGKLSYTHEREVIAGQDGSGAFYRLLTRNVSLAERNGITFMNPGKPLYVDVENGSDGNSISFRDFESGDSFQATMVPYTEGSGGSLKSSFYINLDRSGKGGSRKAYTVGSPQIKRPQISLYRIKKVIADPQSNALVFVIETHKQTTSGFDIRYMVETIKL